MLSRIAKPFLQRTLAPILVEAGAGFDVAVVRLAQEIAKRAAPSRHQDVAERKVYLERVATDYAAVDRDAFYAEPPALEQMHEIRVRDLPADGRSRRGEVVDLSWQSGWRCVRDDQRGRFARWRENDTAHVRMFRHARREGDGVARPTVICVHGYRAGTFTFEERAWGASWLYGLGLDVALFTLPFHALRAPANRKTTPLFPTADVARTNEAFGQSMWDLRRLSAWLRGRGASHVGAMGMSLGGYTVSLLATVDPTMDFIVPFIPLADLTDVVVEHEALRGTVVPEGLIDAGKCALELVRPLSRKPLVSSDKVLVIGAEGDRITKRSHAESLAAHFSCELVVFPGAHLLQFGRREGFSAIARFLSQRSLIAERGRRLSSAVTPR